jgi:Cys-tRNA(Pro)/Cys-tRNA(Cys) deacylase
VVVPSNKRVNLNKIAGILHVKRLQLADKEELSYLLAYPPTAVSPIGANSIPVLIEENLLRYPTILVGAGKVSVEIEISPHDLKDISKATALPLIEGQK